MIPGDALPRFRLREMPTQPEMPEAVPPDVHLAASLVWLSQVIPAGIRETVRRVVRKVMDELMKKLEELCARPSAARRTASQHNRRPCRPRTLRANLRHWQPEPRNAVPQTLAGHGCKARRPQREVILCIDLYASIFGAVLASLPAVATRLVMFDTAVVDLTEQLQDPVDLLFGVQPGGGTDIARACRLRDHEPCLGAWPPGAWAETAAVSCGGGSGEVWNTVFHGVSAGPRFSVLSGAAAPARPGAGRDTSSRPQPRRSSTALPATLICVPASQRPGLARATARLPPGGVAR